MYKTNGALYLLSVITALSSIVVVYLAINRFFLKTFLLSVQVLETHHKTCKYEYIII